MSKTPSPERLSEEFCRILNEWLDPSEIREINRRNALPEYTGCCASHDFCDPNQAMADALEVFGIEFHPELCDLINAAWDLAKGRQFAAPDSGEKTRTMIRK